MRKVQVVVIRTETRMHAFDVEVVDNPGDEDMSRAQAEALSLAQDYPWDRLEPEVDHEAEEPELEEPDYPLITECPPSMIPCRVVSNYGAYVIDMQDAEGNDRELVLQTDYDLAAFAVACGVVRAPADWDGCPSKLPTKWYERLDDIEYCPDDYLSVAE